MILRKFQQFMLGRYGTDQLNVFLLISGIVWSLFGSLFFRPLYLVADILYVWALFRMFSRNIPSRQRENMTFLKLWAPVGDRLKLLGRKLADRRIYKYFRCPGCRQRLRAPRGRGQIEVTCQKCRKVFRTRT